MHNVIKMTKENELFLIDFLKMVCEYKNGVYSCKKEHVDYFKFSKTIKTNKDYEKRNNL